MNKARAKKIQTVIERLAKLKEMVEELQQEEQDAFDNASEKLQESEKGEAMEEAARDLEQSISSLDEAIEYLTLAQGASA